MDSLADVGLVIVQRFKLLEEVKQLDSVTSQVQEWPANLFRAQFDRFELWAVNLGLFVMGHGSLDYRIRDSESMRESIYQMMQSLNRSLDDVLDYVNGNTEQGDEDSDSDSELESDAELLLGSIKDPIDRLYKLAVWIRNPATRLASSKARNFKQIDEYSNIDLFESYKSHDYDYVSSLFLEYEKHRAMQESTLVESKDKASATGDGEVDSSDHVWEPIRGVLSLYNDKRLKGAESYLVQRIARANGRRRQQFAYWKRHKDKLREHASSFVEAPTRQLTTDDHIINDNIGAIVTPLSVTTATQLRLAQAAGQEILEKEGVLKLDVSEYAPSAWNPSKDTVSFPPPPKISTSDNFFECPYCFTICPISLLSEKAWRAHIIRDLRPYVCTYEQCLTSEQLYDTRDDWIQHEMSTHQRIFRCFEHEEAIFTTLAAYERHVQACHEHNALSAKFTTSTMKNVHRSCPVCSVALGSIQKLQSHIALHLERFAMFSLPRHTDGSEENETSSSIFTTHSENEESFDVDLDQESNVADDFRPGSPRSPTRPHSVRRRQSLYTLELEARIEQLIAENHRLSQSMTSTDTKSGISSVFAGDKSSDEDRKVLNHAVSSYDETSKFPEHDALHKLVDHDDFGGSPQSPTRPYSIRRRQSMHTLDLEARVEQLEAENRHLNQSMASTHIESETPSVFSGDEKSLLRETKPPHEPERGEDEERLEQEAQRQRLAARLRDWDAARGRPRSRIVYDDGTYRYDDSPEQVQDGTHPQPASVVASVHSDLERTESTPPISEALLPIYGQLQTIKKCLVEVRDAGGDSSARELYPYTMKLNSIDNLRVDGKFVVDGNIPEGQNHVCELLDECFDLSRDLIVEIEDATADTPRQPVGSPERAQVDAFLQEKPQHSKMSVDHDDNDELKNRDGLSGTYKLDWLEKAEAAIISRELPQTDNIRILMRPLTKLNSTSNNWQWLSFSAEGAASDKPEFKVLAVTQTAKDIKFSIRIPGSVEAGLSRPPIWCEFYEDPASEQVIILNKSDVLILLGQISRGAAASTTLSGRQVINPGVTKSLSPGTFRIEVRDTAVLDFRILKKRRIAIQRPPSPMMPSPDKSEDIMQLNPQKDGEQVQTALQSRERSSSMSGNPDEIEEFASMSDSTTNSLPATSDSIALSPDRIRAAAPARTSSPSGIRGPRMIMQERAAREARQRAEALQRAEIEQQALKKSRAEQEARVQQETERHSEERRAADVAAGQDTTAEANADVVSSDFNLEPVRHIPLLLDDDTEAQKHTGGGPTLAEEVRTFHTIYRDLKSDIDKEILSENEEAQVVSEARNLIQQMDIRRLEVEELIRQYKKERPGTSKNLKAQELSTKIRSWDIVHVVEATKRIRASRKEQKALVAEEKDNSAHLPEPKDSVPKKKGDEEAELQGKLRAEQKAAVDELDIKATALEEAKRKAKEAAEKGEAKPAPIKFKDAVGRKFSFPFHLCSTWQGMEELIKQAFMHVDVIGPHVQEGHYDLIGPNGEIILPVVWDKVIEPGWAINMTMWPLDKTPSVNNFLTSPTNRPKLTPFGPTQDSGSSKSRKGKEVKRKYDKNGPRSPISRLDNGSDGDAENSDMENSEAERVGTTKNAVINAASKKLDEIGDELRSKWVPLAWDYIKAPPRDPKKREYAHRELFENILQQIIFKLDAVEAEGIAEIRQRRKELVRDAQEVLKRLDHSKAASEAEDEYMAKKPKEEEEEEEVDENERAARVQLQELAQANANYWPRMSGIPMNKAEEEQKDEEIEVKEVAREDAVRHGEERARYTCHYPDCGESFGTKTHLQRHINERHEKRKWFHCPVTNCDYSMAGGKTFLRRDNWKRHMIKIHNIDEQALPEPFEVDLVVNRS